IEYIYKDIIGNKIEWIMTKHYISINNHPITTTEKHSSFNIYTNVLLTFKGFVIKEVPETKFQEGELAYTSITGVGKQFTGINTTRTIESEDFDGVAFQGAGKAGEFILPANKKAVIKVVEGESGN